MSIKNVEKKYDIKCLYYDNTSTIYKYSTEMKSISVYSTNNCIHVVKGT